MIWAVLKMSLALGIIIAFLIFLVRMSKRWEGVRRGVGSDAGIRVLTSKLIAPQKYVSLVEIGGEVLALGVSAQQITFLTKIENKEMVKKNPADPAFKPEAISWLKAFPFFQKKGNGEVLGGRDEE